MRKEGKELDELTASLKEPLESTEIRYKILEKISEPAVKNYCRPYKVCRGAGRLVCCR